MADTAMPPSICPVCGGMPEMLDGVLACAGCGARARADGHVIDWRQPGTGARTLRQRVWRDDLDTMANMRRQLGIIGHYLHPMVIPISPLTWLARARMGRFYERTRSDTDLARRWAAHYLAGIPLGRGLSILDHGAGKGRHVGILSQLGQRVFAQDIAPDAWWANFPDCRFQIVPPEYDHLPWPDGLFDVVLDWGVIEHFEAARVARLAGEVARVLKSGGHWIVLASNARGYAARVPRRYYGRLHDIDFVRGLAARNGMVEARQFYEGFQAPVMPLLINGVRKVCAPWAFDMTDQGSLAARWIPAQRRAIWLLDFRKP
jgi:SAM-dependent methyltransferase